jgi:hypothetical protein
VPSPMRFNPPVHWPKSPGLATQQERNPIRPTVDFHLAGNSSVELHAMAVSNGERVTERRGLVN